MGQDHQDIISLIQISLHFFLSPLFLFTVLLYSQMNQKNFLSLYNITQVIVL